MPVSCSCCCTKVLDFCVQDVCGSMDFDIRAQTSGVYKLVTFFQGVQLTTSKSFLTNDKIIFPLSLFNESYQYTVEIYDPSGARVLIRKNNVDYDCFKFKTVLNVAV